jgi:hypothetical protein
MSLSAPIFALRKVGKVYTRTFSLSDTEINLKNKLAEMAFMQMKQREGGGQRDKTNSLYFSFEIEN